MPKIFHWIMSLIIGCAAAFLITVAAASFFGIIPRIVLSGSMEPAIHTGALCFINTNIPYSDIDEGDIIAFSTSAGTEVTHRVASVEDEGLITKGDANNINDGSPVTASSYIGKTFFSIPYLGYVFNFFSNKRVKIMAIAAAVCCIVSALLNNKNERRRSYE